MVRPIKAEMGSNNPMSSHQNYPDWVRAIW